MEQIHSKLRRAVNGYIHWCPGCNESHILPDTWQFNGNIESPTFHPSFKHTGISREFIDGNWTGNWIKDANGIVIQRLCHYMLTNGVLHYCVDCSHELVGQSVPLPDLPEHMRD
jgi:hypothetical protein